MADVTTIAEIGTAVGTLFLGAATFASTRSANRAARVAERSLLAQLRPLLVPARPEDPDVKVIFGDGQKFLVSGGTGLVEEIDGVVYMAVPLRNAGSGLAVLSRYDFVTDVPLQDAHRPLPAQGALERRERHHRPIAEFRSQQRDIYIAPGDTGFWQAALRDDGDEVRGSVLERLEQATDPISIDLLYGDNEGGQRAVTRFVLMPSESGKWLSGAVFHWTVESADPRELLDGN
jgi:hypothetical protein